MIKKDMSSFSGKIELKTSKLQGESGADCTKLFFSKDSLFSVPFHSMWFMRTKHNTRIIWSIIWKKNQTILLTIINLEVKWSYMFHEDFLFIVLANEENKKIAIKRRVEKISTVHNCYNMSIIFIWNLKKTKKYS